MAATRKITHHYAPSVSWTCIGRPDDPHKTLVNEAGALLYDFINWINLSEAYFFKRVFSFGLQAAGEPTSVIQTTETARHPFVKTVLQYPHVTLELLAFAHEHDDKRTDVVLWTVYADQPVDTAVWVDGQALGKAFVTPRQDTPSHGIYTVAVHEWSHIPSHFRVSSRLEAPSDSSDPERCIAYLSVPYALQPASSHHYGPTPRYQTPILTATPDSPLTGAIIFPVDHEGDDHYNLAWAQGALQAECQFWTDYPLQPVAWQLPDCDVMDMITACARNILQARDVKAGLPEFQVGPTCYRGLWVVDGHFILEAARYLGHESASDQGIHALLRRVNPDGSIMQLPFHIKETSIALATFVRQCELDDDWERLVAMWSVFQNAVRYIRSLREASKARGENAPEYNLMPPTFGDGGLGGGRPEYTTALWTLVGLKQAVRAAKKLGFSADEQWFQAEYDDLLRVFREKAARDMRPLPDGTPYLPMAMPGGGSEHRDNQDFVGEVDPYLRINPGTATWALAHAIYPGEVFAPDDPIVQNFCKLLDQIDDEEGIPAGTGWMPHEALWTYAASFYAHVWLYAGHPDKAIDYLYDFANHATPTRVWREEHSLRSASFEHLWGDMPHNWASAEFIRLTRHLLVFERDNRLDLLPGLPPEWIQPNATIQLESTPTRYGPVTLELTFDDRCNGTLTLGFDPARSLQPERVMLHVPPGFTIEGREAVSPLEIPFVPNQVLNLRPV